MDKTVNLVPPEQPVAMPVQDLRCWNGTSCAPPPAASVVRARAFVFGLTGVLTVAGTYGMYQVISPVNVTWLQLLFAALFALTFTWISFSCASAMIGFLRLWRNAAPDLTLAPRCAMGCTAILMPVYNENPDHVFSALETMARGLVWKDAQRHFDIFILSDTRSDDIAAREWDCFGDLRKRLGAAMGVYYRRRAGNHHRKAGNIAEFVKRWGGRYDHMIVLDADSTMSPDILIDLARAMAADPRAGIIQSLPLLCNRCTPFARMTQFASRIYGPVVAAGLSAWHGRDGNYWGHNAIIRVSAFAASAGLPELRGRKPFGGHILSHDFVEAALMRRAGWGVYMVPELQGSYEETPPSLIDLAVRDRRWAQGNLQHTKVVGARGLNWVSRVHLMQGIMSYLASPLWLLLLSAGMILALIAHYAEPNYFPEGVSLFPAWPVFDPELALRLLAATAAVLYLPKLLGLVLALRRSDIRRGCGGMAGLLKSIAAETLLSMLLSPVMMLIQSRFVLDILIGRDSGWDAQNRAETSLPFRAALRRHAGHMLMGLVIGIAGFSVSWPAFLWFAPIMTGLLLAPFVSWATGSPKAGRLLWRMNVFRIPEESGLADSRAGGSEPAAAYQAAE